MSQKWSRRHPSLAINLRQECKIVIFFSVIGFGKTRGANVTLSRQSACEPHTPVGLVSPFVFTLSVQTFRLTAHAGVLDLDNRLFTVPYVFIVRIERLPVRTVNLDLICT